MLGINIPALPASLRRTNERTVISLLFRLGRASRADLAKAAGISQPTAGKIIADLLSSGILEEVNGTRIPDNFSSNKLGRPGQLLQLNSRRRRFLVIELGVTETNLSALPVAVRGADEWSCSFRTPRTAEGWSAALSKASTGLANGDLWGAIISVPGIVDQVAGRVLFSPNLHWLEQADLPRLAGRALKMPVVLVQEIRALAWGHLVANPGVEDFLLADFGPGVGGAIVVGGKLYENPLALSGEIGHTPVRGNLRKCGCGGRGCLETLASQKGLLQSFREAGGKAGSTWPGLLDHVRKHGLEPWLQPTLEASAAVIAGALNVLGIRRAVITGSMAEMPAEVGDCLAKHIRNGALWARFGEVEATTAPHQRAAGLVAAGIDRLLPENESTSNWKAKP
jgi:N-acetylglucosamine repressor